MIDQPVSVSVPVYEFCDESAAIVTKLAEGERIRVVSSLAGGKEICYKVRVTRDGETVQGYVIGPAIPEIERYQAARRDELKAGRFVLPQAPPAPPEMPKAQDEKKLEPVATPPPPPKPLATVPNSRLT